MRFEREVCKGRVSLALEKRINPAARADGVGKNLPMKNTLRFPGAVLLSALFVSAAAQAAVFDVSTFDDLTNAVATSAAEDTIRLADNVYELPVTLSIAKAITLRGNDANPEAVVLRRVGTGNNRRVVSLSAAATLSGLVVENGYSNGNAGSAAGITASAGTITNCVIRNNKHHSNTYDTAGGVRLGSASCLLVDCVVTNNASTTYYHSGGGVYVGNYAATIRRCVIADNWAAGEGGGIFCSGASKSPVVEDCDILRNVSGTNYWQYSDGRGSMSAGGGVYGGTLRRCTIASNWIGRAQTTFSGGGGAYGSTLYDCLVVGNHATAAATHYGGGLMSCTAYNCTIADNRASSLGGGARNCTLRNCIVWGNAVADGSENGNHYVTSSAQYTCSTPLLTGTGNIALAPRLAADGRIGGVSPCVDTGSSALVGASSTTDLGGAARIQGGSVDMGCYEFDPASAPAPFDVGFGLAADAGDAPFAAQFTARSVGAAPGATVTYRWDFDNDGTVDLETTDASAPHTYTEAGLYSVSVSATDGSASAAYTLPACVLVRSTDIYVARDGSDANDGFTPATPKATIPAALRAVASGGTVHLADGTYPLAATLTIETAITVRGNDTNPEAVILRRSGSGAYNVVTMRNAAATLSGLVVENGYIEGSGAAGITASAGTITNCVIRNNTRSTNIYGTGGGIHFSSANCTLVDCVVSNNATKTYHQAGGGIYVSDVAAKIIRCRFIGNRSACQGGAIHCASASRKPVFEDCLIADNVSGTNYWQNSNGRGNYAGGGGAYGGTLRRCVLSGNWLGARSGSFYGGGAALSSTLYDCLVVSNAATAASTDYAGGLMSCTAYNCTIADNTASSLGGGTRDCTLRNCIVWNNAVADGSENGNHYATSSAQYTCTTPALTGDGNITLDPRLSPDWRIGGVSPCVDTGSSALVTASTSLTDLDGNERIVGNAVDMGCYEFDPASAPVAFDVGFSLAADAGDAPFEAEFTASVLGAAPGAALTYRWDFDGDGTTDLTTAAAVVTNTYAAAGRYTVSLTATDGVSTGTYSLPACVLVRAEDIYVATDGSNDNDGLTPAAPKATLPEGVVCAAAGGTVHLADGTYPLPATVIIDTAVTLRGNDTRPEAVVLRRSGSGFYNVVTIQNAAAVLSGLVVENGYVEGSGAAGITASAGTVTNCVIRNNTRSNNTYGTGGGIYFSGANCTLVDCVVSNNATKTYWQAGGGIYVANVAAKIIRCRFIGNQSACEGGAIYCAGASRNPVIEDCLIADNVSGTNYFGYNDRTGSYAGGGGAYGGTLRRCVLSGNRLCTRGNSFYGGGGALNSTLYSCLVVSNAATAASTDYGGGLKSCTAYNCTVVGNRACVSGGVHDGAARNSIVWGNVATSGNGTDNYGGSPTFAYTCTAPAASGAGNISADPGLRPATAPKPYTLRGGSPCLDVGDNTLANGDTDLAGNPRVFRNVIDLGCYENCDPHGTKLFLR